MASNTLKISSKAPEFELIGVDGNTYSLNSFKYKKGIIIMFTCNHCPYVKAYEERIKEIQKDYNDKGIQIVAINSNDSDQYEDDSYEMMIKRSKEKDFNFVYLRDEDQTVARAYGATHTPQAFLFNEKRELVYEGKIDDNWKEEDKVNIKYLRNALDELLNNSEISVPETFSVGCTIKWKKEN